VTPLDYEYLRKLLKDRSGLLLSSDKQYLIESRLLPLARKGGMSGIGELVQKIKNGAERLTVDVVEAMTTNETFFFRDKVPFDHVRDTVLPQLLKARANRKSLRIWCAASSTGQEPYSLAMLLKDMGCRLAGGPKSLQPICRWKSSRRRRPESTPSLRFSAVCRFSFW
jgi:chemotaxis protein methyltransferase CheR